jgi:phosphoglycerate kinase
VFLKANGFLIRDPDLVPHSRLEWEICEVTRKYRSRLKLPLDVATELNGKRIEWHVSELEAEITAWDIGPDTVDRYSEVLKTANTIAANGPAGFFERPPFDWGTRELLNVLADSSADVLIGGGHLAALAHKMKLDKKFKHISTGGGAMTAVLAGQELPAMTALRRSAEQLLEKGIAKHPKKTRK